MRAKSLQPCLTLWPYGLWCTRLLCPRDSPGKNTGAGYHAFLQGTFPIQGSNPGLLCLLHWQAVFCFCFFFNHYCHLGSPVNIDTSLHLLVKLHEWTYMLLYPWTDMFHICLCVCVSSNEFAEACKHNDMSSCTWSMWACVFACTRARWSESVHMCARAYWSFLIFNNSCFNNICSWETALTAAAAPCYQDCFSPFRITSAQCSLNISPGLIPKQRCNDFC